MRTLNTVKLLIMNVIAIVYNQHDERCRASSPPAQAKSAVSTYWGLVGNKGILEFGSYIGIIYSLLSASKLRSGGRDDRMTIQFPQLEKTI